jgi:3-hydroxyacyl-[acyl-carrier-protein] dehydratase
MMTVGIKGIESVIPHRGDMRMIDEIREYNDRGGVGIHYVRTDEFWCAGHFPGRPIMPGILQIEAMAQTAAFIVFANMHLDKPGMGFFTTMEKIKFRRMVRPGDVLELHVELLKHKLNMYRFAGRALVDGVVVSEATFSAIME